MDGRYLRSSLTATSKRNQEQYWSNCRTKHGRHSIVNKTNGEDKFGELYWPLLKAAVVDRHVIVSPGEPLVNSDDLYVRT
jgi:hypothetical protein